MASTVNHDHPGFSLPDGSGACYGLAGELTLGDVGVLIGAAMDGCVPCQRLAMDSVTADPARATRLWELTAAAAYAARIHRHSPAGAVWRRAVDTTQAPHPRVVSAFPERTANYQYMAALDAEERLAACGGFLGALTTVLRGATPPG